MLFEEEVSAVARELLLRPQRCQAVMHLLGVAGGRPATLVEAAAATGYTREGARHCLLDLQRRAAQAPPAAPVLEQALALAGEIAPCFDTDYGAALVERGLAGSPLSYATVARCAEALARDPPPSMVLLPVGALLHAHHVPIHKGLRGLLRRQARRSGAAQVERCAAMLATSGAPELLARLIRIRVTCDPSFRWIDAGSGWFWVPGVRNPMLTDFRKLLAVCNPIASDSLHAGVSRFYRRHGSVPPPEELLQWCRQIPGLVVDGNRVAAEPPLDPRQVLAPEELRLWEALRVHGGQVSERVLRAEWVARGGKLGTLRVIRMNAPFAYRPAPQTYSLRTPDLPAGACRDVLARENESAAITAWTPGGRIVILYALTEGRLREPLFRLPNVHWQSLGGEFRLLGPGGQDAGTVDVKTLGWVRLDALFKQARPQRGMHLELEFDLATRVLRASFLPPPPR